MNLDLIIEKYLKESKIHKKIKMISKNWNKKTMKPIYNDDGTGEIIITKSSTDFTVFNILDGTFSNHLKGEFGFKGDKWNNNKQTFDDFITNVKKINDNSWKIEFIEK